MIHATPRRRPPAAFARATAKPTDWSSRPSYGSLRLKCWAGCTPARSARRFDELNEGKPVPAKQDRRHDLFARSHMERIAPPGRRSRLRLCLGAARSPRRQNLHRGGSFVRGQGSYNGSGLPAYRRFDLIECHITGTPYFRPALPDGVDGSLFPSGKADVRVNRPTITRTYATTLPPTGAARRSGPLQHI